MFDILMFFLKQGIPMGFITGRDMAWLRSELIKGFEDYTVEHKLDKKILDLLYIAGEFGSVTTEYTLSERNETINKNFAIPQELRKELVDHFQRFKKFLYVEEKQTIFSLRGNSDIGAEEFQKIKLEAVESFKKKLRNYPEIEVLSDRIAINIRNKKANKTSATDNFISWLKEKKISPEKFFVFGDSPTDLEMGLELQKQKLPFEFIYVGDEDEFNGMHHSFPVIITKAHCDEGTREYLQAHAE